MECLSNAQRGFSAGHTLNRTAPRMETWGGATALVSSVEG